MTVVPRRRERSPRSALFFQDDWKLSRRLTVNLGLRYEIEQPSTEAENAAVNGLDLTTALPIQEAARATYARRPLPELAASEFKVRGGLLYAGVNGRREGLWIARTSNFMPRIGLAWQIDSKTVLRSGFGLFYDALGVIRSDAVQTGYSRTTSIHTTSDNIVPRQDAYTNPFPDGLAKPVGNTLGLMTDIGNGLSAPYPEAVKTPRGQRMSLGFQRQLPLGFVVDATYAANRGYNLPVSTEHNALPLQYLSRSMTRDNATITFLGANFPNPFYGIIPLTAGNSAQNMSRGQLLKPYPHYGSLRMNETVGRSWYDSMQLRVDRRMANGFTFNLAYTLSKALEQTAYRDPSEPGPEKRYASSDRTHTLQLNGIFEAPFGRGRHWGRSWDRALDLALGGWQFTSMYRIETGYPISVGNVLLKPGSTFADLALPKGEQRWERWFNTSIFETAASVQPASNLRYYSSLAGNVRYMGFNMLDLILAKKLNLTERVAVHLRAECYNALNAANLMNLNTNPTDGNFGRLQQVNGYARQYQFSTRLQF